MLMIGNGGMETMAPQGMGMPGGIDMSGFPNAQGAMGGMNMGMPQM